MNCSSKRNGLLQWNVTLNVKADCVPKSIADARSQYRLFLTLIGDILTESEKQTLIAKSESLYNTLIELPRIRQLFDTTQKRKFLKQLVIKHAFIIKKNSIQATLQGGRSVSTLGLVFSLFNHACAPNLLNFTTGYQQVCITMRPIKKGEQLFVSYICADIPTVRRKNYLLANFGFSCQCEKCDPIYSPAEVAKLKADPGYQFFHRNSKPDFTTLLYHPSSRRSIKKKCIEILNKHGRHWSQELESVLELYIKSGMYEH